MNFGIIANFQRPDAADTVIRTIEWCRQHDNNVLICNDMLSFVNCSVESCPRSELWKKIDVLISMGGDGTMLSSVRALAGHAVPILGVNIGSLGFLTQITVDQLEDALRRVVKKDYRIEERMMLKTSVEHQEQLDYPYALNDIVVDRGSVGRVINISLYANSDYICSYTADGLIISTPTGSTAYSLAVGGPILNPMMQAIIVSPISAFSLTSRPLIFPPDYFLEARIQSGHGNAMLTIDGQVAARFNLTGTVKVSRANQTVQLIRFPENSFYDILRNKLHWGKLPVVNNKKGDSRN
jgi:NAD+ kinase